MLALHTLSRRPGELFRSGPAQQLLLSSASSVGMRSALRLLLSPLFVTMCCTAHLIQSPPPVHAAKESVAASAECRGRFAGWQWDKCSLDNATVWTAVAFGHVNMTPGQPAPRTMGTHIQYSPLTRQLPHMVNFDRKDVVQLPPMVLALYFESETDHSSLWKPEIKLVYDVELCESENNAILPEEEEAFKSQWYEMTVDGIFGIFACACNQTAILRDSLQSFMPNTEYIADNLMGHVPKSVFPEMMEPAAGCFWVNVDASISSSSTASEAAAAVAWHASFAVSFDHKTTSRSKENANSISNVAPKRSGAHRVTHKMCPSMSSGDDRWQRFDPNSKTLSMFFENGLGKVSVTILSASVTHNQQRHAVAEFLVWFEVNDTCEEVLLYNHCTSAPISLANLTCSVGSVTVPAHVETQNFMLNGHARERVVTCVFDSSLFAPDNHTVVVQFDHGQAVALCSLPQHRSVRKMVACSHANYNADMLEARWPGVLQSWILYHVRLSKHHQSGNCMILILQQVKHLGFDHFSFYDVDGSALPYLTPLLNSSFLSYFKSWSPTPCLHRLTSSLKYPYCTETLLENQCVWNARGTAEWAMLIHAPDCFLNDGVGMPALFGLLDSLDHSKSSLLLPTLLFEFDSVTQPTPERKNGSTAADIFTFFNVRTCQLLNAFRHLPVVDPHMIQVTRVHEALDGLNLHARAYTASLAVNHYIQMFSSRTAVQIEATCSDGMITQLDRSVDHCVDDRMAHVSEVVSSLLETYAG